MVLAYKLHTDTFLCHNLLDLGEFGERGISFCVARQDEWS